MRGSDGCVGSVGVAAGRKLSWHPDRDPRSLTEQEITAVGLDLYSLLRGFDGYQVAIVGWNAEEAVDLQELENDWVSEGDIDGLHGLVVATDLRDRWRVGDAFIPFTSGYWWIPYRGHRNVYS